MILEIMADRELKPMMELLNTKEVKPNLLMINWKLMRVLLKNTNKLINTIHKRENIVRLTKKSQIKSCPPKRILIPMLRKR
jgi:hypothetical protein